MKTSSKDDINRLLNSKLYALLVKCLNEQNKKSKSLVEINYLNAAMFTAVGDKEYSTNECNNMATNSNYVETLIKLVIYKRNKVLDSLVFSLCKTICQLTPRLFGSIFKSNEEVNLFHESIINRLTDKKLDSQSLNSISKFLCTLVEFQPSFFQLLANISIKKDKDDKGIVYEEGNKSIFKYIFELLDNLNENKVSRIIASFRVSLAN